MSREFKFRAWHRSAGILSRVFDLFGYGNIHQEMDLNACEVMQYTGLKDENGIEAFEGDICINEKGRIAKIIWLEPAACFDFVALNSIGDNYGYSAQMFKYKITIIGNIHENPELLKLN